jgi:hypothetical protein
MPLLLLLFLAEDLSVASDARFIIHSTKDVAPTARNNMELLPSSTLIMPVNTKEQTVVTKNMPDQE